MAQVHVRKSANDKIVLVTEPMCTLDYLGSEVT